MIGRLRVPLCFLTRQPYSEPAVKFDFYTAEKIRKNWSVRLFVYLSIITNAIITSCKKKKKIIRRIYHKDIYKLLEYDKCGIGLIDPNTNVTHT